MDFVKNIKHLAQEVPPQFISFEWHGGLPAFGRVQKAGLYD